MAYQSENEPTVVVVSLSVRDRIQSKKFNAQSWIVENGILSICNGNDVIATFASGEWIEVSLDAYGVE